MYGMMRASRRFPLGSFAPPAGSGFRLRQSRRPPPTSRPPKGTPPNGGPPAAKAPRYAPSGDQLAKGEVKGDLQPPPATAPAPKSRHRHWLNEINEIRSPPGI